MSAAKPAKTKRKKPTAGPSDEAIPEKVLPTLNKKGMFTKDLATMMYGFGDDQIPYKESVDLVEEMTVSFLEETMHRAMTASASKGGKMTTEDVMFLVRKDTRKYTRVKELLRMSKEIAAAKKDLEGDNIYKDGALP